MAKSDRLPVAFEVEPQAFGPDEVIRGLRLYFESQGATSWVEIYGRDGACVVLPSHALLCAAQEVGLMLLNHGEHIFDGGLSFSADIGDN